MRRLTEEDQAILAEICEQACALQFEASAKIAQGYIDTFTADGTWTVYERSESVDAALKDITVKMLDKYGEDWDDEVIDLVYEALGK